MGYPVGPFFSQELWEEVEIGYQILPLLLALKAEMFSLEKI